MSALPATPPTSTPVGCSTPGSSNGPGSPEAFIGAAGPALTALVGIPLVLIAPAATSALTYLGGREPSAPPGARWSPTLRSLRWTLLAGGVVTFGVVALGGLLQASAWAL